MPLRCFSLHITPLCCLLTTQTVYYSCPGEKFENFEQMALQLYNNFLTEIEKISTNQNVQVLKNLSTS